MMAVDDANPSLDKSQFEGPNWLILPAAWGVALAVTLQYVAGMSHHERGHRTTVPPPSPVQFTPPVTDPSRPPPPANDAQHQWPHGEK